jgi:hypothetical protein
MKIHMNIMNNHKVTLRCEVLSTAINGIQFFKEEDGQAITVMTHHYTHMTETFLMPRVQNLPRQFQQDGATAHMANINMTVIYSLFLKQVIPISLMVLASLLTIPNCSGDTQKVKCMVGCWPADIHVDELKAGIQEEIIHISEETLWEGRTSQLICTRVFNKMAVI